MPESCASKRLGMREGGPFSCEVHWTFILEALCFQSRLFNSSVVGAGKCCVFSHTLSIAHSHSSHCWPAGFPRVQLSSLQARVPVTSGNPPAFMAEHIGQVDCKSIQGLLSEQRRCIARVHRALHAQSIHLATGEAGSEIAQKRLISQAHGSLRYLSGLVSDMERKLNEVDAMAGKPDA